MTTSPGVPRRGGPAQPAGPASPPRPGSVTQPHGRASVAEGGERGSGLEGGLGSGLHGGGSTVTQNNPVSLPAGFTALVKPLGSLEREVDVSCTKQKNLRSFSEYFIQKKSSVVSIDEI